ncbi:MAG TPA: hypothetical protein VHI76_01765, partial [Solirubrobacterales bacterium]|nr:hypothetical protein [Solirubrobacterales bacterium]
MLQGKMRLEERAWARRAGGTLVAVLAATCIAATAGLPPAASGRAYTPPKKKIYHGMRETGELEYWFRFGKAVSAHPAVMHT